MASASKRQSKRAPKKARKAAREAEARDKLIRWLVRPAFTQPIAKETRA
jgi:hypothetical protein